MIEVWTVFGGSVFQQLSVTCKLLLNLFCRLDSRVLFIFDVRLFLLNFHILSSQQGNWIIIKLTLSWGIFPKDWMVKRPATYYIEVCLIIGFPVELILCFPRKKPNTFLMGSWQSDQIKSVISVCWSSCQLSRSNPLLFNTSWLLVLENNIGASCTLSKTPANGH